jgi:hypothetical protein
METDRIISEADYRDALRALAEVSVIAFSLQQDLKPLRAEDIQSGAMHLTQETIQAELERIQNRLAELALITLKASREEWFAANDTVQ